MRVPAKCNKIAAIATKFEFLVIGSGARNPIGFSLAVIQLVNSLRRGGATRNPGNEAQPLENRLDGARENG